MASSSSPYRAALNLTLRQTAAAYGYTLTIAATVAVLTSVRGKPGEGELFLFVAGGLTAFVALEAMLLLRPSGDARPDAAFPFAGALNFLSVMAALGAATGTAHAVHSPLAWLLAPLASTAVYMLLVAVQVAVVAARRS